VAAEGATAADRVSAVAAPTVDNEGVSGVEVCVPATTLTEVGVEVLVRYGELPA
jgi:hypothetical protein